MNLDTKIRYVLIAACLLHQVYGGYLFSKKKQTASATNTQTQCLSGEDGAMCQAQAIAMSLDADGNTDISDSQSQSAKRSEKAKRRGSEISSSQDQKVNADDSLKPNAKVRSDQDIS